MKWMLIKIIFVVLAWGISASSFAAMKTVVCNNCSESSMIKAAESGASKYGHSNVMVVDVKNKFARKFSINNGEDKRGEPVFDIYETYMTNAEQSDVNLIYIYADELVNVVKAAEVKSKAQFGGVKPSSIAKSSTANSSDVNRVYAGSIDVRGNPYDFLTASYNRNDVYDYYFAGNSSKLTSIISSTLNTIKIPSMYEMGIYLEIDFYSDDGLTQSKNGFLSVSINNITKTFDVIGGRDASNNSIPMTINAAKGTFAFNGGSGGDKSKFEGYVRTLTVGGSGSTGGGGCTLVPVSVKVIGDRYIITYACK